VLTGGWRLIELLGRGGMAPVYRVRRDGEDDAAAKLMRLGRSGRTSEDTTWKARELFERSAAVLSKLEHAGLPKLYDFAADDDGTLVMVRELFEGHTLQQRIEDEHWHPDGDETIALLRDVLELLHYLHDRPRPIVHRDIKPSNVMFRGEQPVLVDFDSVAGVDRTSSTTIVVSPGYTAPEQLAGVTSPSADLFSLGATFLFVVSGREPHDFERDARGALEAKDALKRCPAQLADTILGLLEPDPIRRVGSASEALARLDRPAASLAPRSPNGPGSLAPGRWPLGASRYAVVAAAVAVLAVGAVTASVVLMAPEPEAHVKVSQPAVVPAVPVPPSPVPTPLPPVPIEDTPAVVVAVEEPPACASCPPAHGCLDNACVPEVSALVAGRYVQCWILVDDRLQCAASFNRHGQTGTGNGDAQGWQNPRDLPAVRLAHAGTGQVCAVDQDEQLWCWGDNRYGFIPDQGKRVPVPTQIESPGRVVSIALGYDRPYLLTDDHKLWVRRDGGPWRRALRGKSIVEIDAENFLVVARDDKGRVWTWTHAPKKVSRVPELDGVVELAVGKDHACARDDAGAVTCWGANDWGQVGAEDPRLQLTPVAVELPEPAAQVDAFEELSCARGVEHDVYCWGKLFGATQPTPRPMGLGPATAVAVTGGSVCALGEDRLRRCVVATKSRREPPVNER